MNVAPTLCRLFQQTVGRCGPRPALRVTGPGDRSEAVTWAEFGDRVARLARGLAGLGVTHADPVALMTDNTPDFHIADMAVLHAGGVPFSLHGRDPVADLESRVEVAGARVLLTESAYLPQACALAAAAPVIRHVVVLDGLGGPGGAAAAAELDVESVHRLAVPAEELERRWRSVTAEDTATLIFTSGTTGRPKAVQLPHRAITESLRNFLKVAPGGEDGRVLSYLPLTHIAERFMSYYLAVGHGAEICCVTDPADLYDAIVRERPTRFFGVPRVYTKLADRAREIIEADPAMTAALEAGLTAVEDEQHGGRPRPDTDAATGALGPVAGALGLDRTAYRGVATAPSSYQMLAFFSAIGLPVGDIWGMSEAIMCTANPAARIKLGTVGRFLDEVEARVADDGELLVRGPNTFTGYLGDPVRTGEVRDADGWLHTGDVGRVDDEGYLTITGRKNELLVTATGKNIVPTVIEAAIKEASPMIDYVVAIADGRRFVTALVALDGGRVADFARARGLDGGLAELVRHPAVIAEVEHAVAEGNSRLPHAETVRSWRLLPCEWLPGGDEVTPTMKLRRANIQRKYAAEIEELYAGGR